MCELVSLPTVLSSVGNGFLRIRCDIRTREHGVGFPGLLRRINAHRKLLATSTLAAKNPQIPPLRALAVPSISSPPVNQAAALPELQMAGEKEEEAPLVLVARKGCFGLPTACPSCLPVYLYLRFANAAFDLEFDVNNPDSDHVPYVECGDAVIFNNEKGGVIEGLKREHIVDLDPKSQSSCFPEWLSTLAMVNSWLVEAAQYELWVASDGTAANKIYFSDLPWPIGKVLHWKQIRTLKQQLGITKENVTEREEEIYRKAALAYEALSLRLGDQRFFFEDRPTSLDAVFLGHALFVLHVFSETSVLRSNLLKHDNLVKYSEDNKITLLESSSSSTSRPKSSSGASPIRRPFWSSKPKPKTKREKTEEEKTFRRRAKYFLATQLVAVLVFLSLFGGSDAEMEDGDEEMSYDD